MNKIGYKEELCSRIIRAGHRVYYIDAKVDRLGNRFVAISELKGGKDSPRERHRIHIYEEDMPRFLDAMGDALTALAEHRKEVSQDTHIEETMDNPAIESGLALNSSTQIDIPSNLEDILTDEN